MPPAGGWSAAYQSARKQPISPKANMKPLYWTRIQVPVSTSVTPVEEEAATDLVDASAGVPKSPSGCLWEKIDEDDVVKKSMIQRFADLFSRQPVTKKVAEKQKSPIKGKTKVVANILDPKRAHNVNILVTSLHLEIAEVENAVYNLDTSVVTTDILTKLNEAAATSDEISAIKSHLEQQTDVALGKPEQFLYDLSRIASFEDRVACIMFEIQFQELIMGIETKLSNFKATCDALMNRPSIADVFSIILTLGNYMNGGNRERGQADGFGLEILPKLKDVKGRAESRTPTLLHYIVNVYIDKYAQDKGIESWMDADIALPVPEPQDIEKASLVDFETTENELKQLSVQIGAASRRVTKVLNMIELKNKNRKKKAESDDQVTFLCRPIEFHCLVLIR